MNIKSDIKQRGDNGPDWADRRGWGLDSRPGRRGDYSEPDEGAD
jgi:hypothetical protein